MRIKHSIIIHSGKKKYREAGGFNSFSFLCFKRTIMVQLGEFKFRKNVSHKKIAETVNNYFLIEMLCAMTHGVIFKPILCKGEYEDCPLDHVWEEMKLRMK